MTQQRLNPNTAPPSDARQQLFQMALGGLTSQLLYVAAKLGIADLLQDGPRRCEDLACASGTHAASLYRVLRALASLGVFTEVESGCFGLTPLAAYLRTDSHASFRIMAIYLGEELSRAFCDLLACVRSGDPVFDGIFGMTYFEYLDQHPDAAQTFNAAMTALGAAAEDPAVNGAYDFSSAGTVIDVGGGQGGLLSSILTAIPGIRGILFDRPAVVEGARPQLQARGVAERCELASGDFFVSVPSGGDTYILKRIIHDWGDERSIAILKNCRRAMSTGGRILVIEDVLPPGDEFAPGKLGDVLMMVILKGRERSAAEYRALLSAAGLELVRIIPTASPMSIIEGTPV